jgi:tetratricopeptide (TPR) repeat protein
MAYLLLGETHINEVWLGSTKSPGNSLRNGAELAQKALSMDASLGHAHYLFAQIYILQREFEKGIAEARRAVELEPNGAHAHWFLGSALTFAGRPEEAIPVGKKAISLNPYSPSTYFRTVAKAYRNMGQYDEAISYAKKAVERSPGNQLSRSILITCYTLAGSDEEARAQVKELLEIHPEFCVTGHPGFYKDPAIGKRVNETSHLKKERSTTISCGRFCSPQSYACLTNLLIRFNCIDSTINLQVTSFLTSSNEQIMVVTLNLKSY